MHSAGTQFPTTAERDQRIKDNLPLVKFCVSRMHIRNAPSGLDFNDLVGHGTLGLIQAADRFNDTQGVTFSNFAVTRIRGAVLDAMRALDPVGRMNRHASKQIADHFNALALKLGRNPTPEEVQAATRIGEAQYWSARNASSITTVSLDFPLGGGSSLAESVSDASPPVSAGIERRELTRALAAAVAALPERDQLVLSLYYVEGLSMKEVARAMAISETRVSQLLSRTYARLRANRSLASAA